MDKIKVLVAEDELAVLEIMSKKISHEGFEVIAVADGASAWQKIQSEAPDVIVLDRNMPEMDGFSVLELLRRTPPHKKWMPVIIVSARGEIKDLDDGMALQADHYLVKPCPVEEIVKGIRLMLSLIPLRKAETEL